MVIGGLWRSSSKLSVPVDLGCGYFPVRGQPSRKRSQEKNGSKFLHRNISIIQGYKSFLYIFSVGRLLQKGEDQTRDYDQKEIGGSCNKELETK